MASVNKNKSKGGRSRSTRNGKSGKAVFSGASKAARPKVVRELQQLAPDIAETRLVYADANAFSGAGSYNTWQFRLNSAFDPDYTFTGAQPVGYDQWSAFYGLYKVYKAKLEVTCIPTTKPLVFNAFAAPNVTVPTAIQPAMAQADSKSKVCGIYDTKTIVIDIDIPSALGVDRAEFGDITYGATTAQNPSGPLYATVQCFNADASATHSFTLVAKLIQYVQFYQRGYLGISLTPPQSKEEVVPDKSSVTSSKPKRTFAQIVEEFDLIERAPDSLPASNSKKQ